MYVPSKRTIFTPMLPVAPVFSSLHVNARRTLHRPALMFVSLMLVTGFAGGQPGPQLSPEVREFVKIDAPIVVLNHVRVIDGTGAAPRADQAVVIQQGKIAAIGDSAGVKTPDQAKVLDLSGYSVIPGLVGMHNHLHYTADQSTDAPGQLINAITWEVKDA